MKKVDLSKVGNGIDRLGKGLASNEEKIRWKSAIELQGHVKKAHSKIWKIILKNGSSKNSDLQTAVATCLLEHLLEFHFDKYFPLVRNEIKGGNLYFSMTFRKCWKYGQSEIPGNQRKWDFLQQLTSKLIKESFS